jgi:hypothetical protein
MPAMMSMDSRPRPDSPTLRGFNAGGSAPLLFYFFLSSSWGSSSTNPCDCAPVHSYCCSHSIFFCYTYIQPATKSPTMTRGNQRDTDRAKAQKKAASSVSY